jgi:hypothetical protein
MKEVRLTIAGRDGVGGLASVMFTAIVLAGAVWLATQTHSGATVADDMLDAVSSVAGTVGDAITGWARRY